MTDVATVTCTKCGAENLGTNFCENCGTRMAQVDEAPTVAGIPAVSTPVVAGTAMTHPSVRRGGTAFRVLSLLLLIFGNFLPTFFLASNPLGMFFGFAGTPFVAINVTGAMLLALFMVIATAVGSAGPGGKAIGVIFALAFAVLTLLADFVPGFSAWQYGSVVINAICALTIFMSWGAGRPFRGPGWAGLLVFVAFEFANYYSQVGIESTVVGLPEGLYLALEATGFVLAFVGLVILFERRHSAYVPV